jgi:hypothetical protein
MICQQAGYHWLVLTGTVIRTGAACGIQYWLTNINLKYRNRYKQGGYDDKEMACMHRTLKNPTLHR